VRWLLTGAQGLLGRDAALVLRERGITVTAADRTALDVTDGTAVQKAVAGHDVVLNCAAWTDVDKAEAAEEYAFAVNEAGTRSLARACAREGARLVHISTDYVFDGAARTPYAETAPVAPRSVYGRSKAAGEAAALAELPDGHLILRSAWLYGAHGRCFPRTIARLALDRGSVDVVDDQSGQPTWTRDLAELAVRLVQAGVPAGTYHASASGETTWFGFAKEVVAAAGLAESVVRPVSSADHPRPAPRPSYSVLGHAALAEVGITPIGDWRDRWRAAASEVLRDL
jgi:dTDP-4-dehydrorhamnose reductase